MKKKLFITLIGLLLFYSAKSQFVLTAMIDTIPTSVYHMCAGDTLDLNAVKTDYLMNNNFNNSSIGVGWSITSGLVASFNNPCPPVTLPATGATFWFGGNAYPRELITIGYDIHCYTNCYVEFDMKYGANQNSANCESPDEPTEGVHLTYSTTGGATYTQFTGEIAPSGTFGSPGYVNGSGGYWTPVSGNAATGPYYTWNHYKTQLPATAISTNTKIRWYQQLASGNTFDHWGIDNVQISCPTIPYPEWSCVELPFWTNSNLNPTPFVINQPGTYHYVIQIVDLTGNSHCVETDTIKVIVHDPNILTVNSGLDSIAICIGESATLYAQSSISGVINYQWNTTPVTNNDTAIVSPLANRQYIITAKDNIGCTVKDSIKVIVQNKPIPFATNDTACIGNSVTLTASGGEIYQWSNGFTNDTITLSPLSTTTYKVIISTLAGCKDSIDVTAIIHPLPSIQLTNNTTICMGDTATLTVSGGANYQWSTSETTPDIKVSPSTLTTYSVIVTSINGCIDSSNVDVDAIPLPTPLILQDVDTICKGTSTTLIASGGSSYLWNTGETVSTILIAPYMSSFYSVTVSNTLNNVTCSATANTKMNVRNCNLIFVPNSFVPFGYNTIFKPSGELKAARNYSFQIFNRWGQLIYETNDTEKGWDGRLNGEYVPAGAYVYYLKFDNVDDKFEKIGTVTVIF